MPKAVNSLQAKKERRNFQPANVGWKSLLNCKNRQRKSAEKRWNEEGSKPKKSKNRWHCVLDCGQKPNEAEAWIAAGRRRFQRFQVLLPSQDGTRPQPRSRSRQTSMPASTVEVGMLARELLAKPGLGRVGTCASQVNWIQKGKAAEVST